MMPRAVPVTTPNGIIGIAAGKDTSVALRLDGTLWTWGDNTSGQLGNGSIIASTRPGRALLSPTVEDMDIAAAGAHVVTLAPVNPGDQGIWTWGLGGNTMGDGSSGTRVDRLVPAPIPSLTTVSAVRAGGPISLAVLDDASVWTWGYASGGQLGRVVDVMGPSAQVESMPSPIPGFSLGDNSWLTADPDGDGLTTTAEWRLGTDALRADTNGDGVSDGAPLARGIDPIGLDSDGDGVRNAVEAARGTDPLRADTDGDGVADDLDCYPTDPTRSTCAPPTPGDTTPPVILLTEPTNALIISTFP